MSDCLINLVRLSLLIVLTNNDILLLEELEIALHPNYKEIDILADLILTFSNSVHFLYPHIVQN